MRATPAKPEVGRRGRNLLLAGVLLLGLCGWCGAALPGWSQSGNTKPAAKAPDDSVARWMGLTVKSIAFEGVAASRLGALATGLAQQEGKPLTQEKLQQSLRQLFATGLYENIQVEAQLEAEGVVLVFRGAARMFIGTVNVVGAKGATLNTQLERASQLLPGTRLTEAKLDRALDQMRQTLAQNGFHEPVITHEEKATASEQLVDITFHVVSGSAARVGTVQVSGDSGMSAEDFRHHARLRSNSRVDHDTANRALAGVLKEYKKNDRLEAEIKLESQQYSPTTHRADYRFSANRGPVVKVLVEGVNMSQERIRHVIPVFEEGTVDEDLLNEGNRRLRDYYQRLGYFDVKVDHAPQTAQPDRVTIVFHVRLGERRRVERVSVTGNHYFNSSTLTDLLSVHAANVTDRHGAYSQALVNADCNAIQSVYRNNGFAGVKVTAESSGGESSTSLPGSAGSQSARNPASPGRKTAPLAVVYRVEEGEQTRVASARLEGNAQVDAKELTPLMNTTAGQLLSPQNLANDRDALTTEYLSRGFNQAQVEVSQQPDPSHANQVNVVFHITEGEQTFVRKVLFRGLDTTRPGTVARAITLHPGDPLNQTALQQTQRNLYDFSLFNEVTTAVENPSGGEASKTVLLQATEARRWVLTYGFGFEEQTGTPLNNCQGANAAGVACNPNGKTGWSPHGLLDLTRNSLFGREQSASLRASAGFLAQKVDLLYQIPHFEGSRNLGLSLSGGYANSLDVTTYVASKLEGSMRWSEHFDAPQSLFSKANTFVYEFDFRRVKVQASNLQVAPSEIAKLSRAVRVAGPALTWIRDTRDSPFDAHHGTYTSFQDFFSLGGFGAQADFNRLDVSNSNYWSFGKGNLVLARNTRYGQERAFGSGGTALIPLPERLYAGGGASLRSFGSNSAGPRDPETGFPVGGAGTLINSTELRLPPPTLPWTGTALSFVLFHDMGNVFTNAGDAWVSALRVRQPKRENCTDTSLPAATAPSNSTGLVGMCSFNYFSHAPGLGLRYHTPVGPLRLDFSYNLNPPIYPVIYNYSNQNWGTSEPYVSHSGHFNFFFSFGQTF